MSVRVRRNGGATWRRALAVSLGLHALLLLALGMGAVASSTGGGDTSAVTGIVPAFVETPTMIDLAAVEMVPTDPTSAPPTPPHDLSAAAPADQARAISSSPDPAARGGIDHRSPAPDRGAGRGRPIDDPAWRRDTTTLHERLTDGAETYQPSHVRTAPRATSPQAVRREPVTGLGDSTATHRAQRVRASASYGVVDPTGPGVGVATLDGVAPTPPVPANLAVPEAQRAILASSRGPLATEQGPRSFDVESPGFMAADNRAEREASQEFHPGITDLTVAAVAGSTAAGRGPSDAPGAVAHSSQGAAPSLMGARGASGTPGNDQWTEERRYDRYTQEIGDRVNKALVFPRTLAVRLEQGETILRFVVKPDGKLGGSIQVKKASGFAEFDQAALDAVRKALPFRPMPDPGRAQALVVTLPVTFSNPVIR